MLLKTHITVTITQNPNFDIAMERALHKAFNEERIEHMLHFTLRFVELVAEIQVPRREFVYTFELQGERSDES